MREQNSVPERRSMSASLYGVKIIKMSRLVINRSLILWSLDGTLRHLLLRLFSEFSLQHCLFSWWLHNHALDFPLVGLLICDRGSMCMMKSHIWELLVCKRWHFYQMNGWTDELYDITVHATASEICCLCLTELTWIHLLSQWALCMNRTSTSYESGKNVMDIRHTLLCFSLHSDWLSNL